MGLGSQGVEGGDFDFSDPMNAASGIRFVAEQGGSDDTQRIDCRDRYDHQPSRWWWSEAGFRDLGRAAAGTAG
jgi:hypothetical protein